jgi:hypothetical protein
MNRKVLAFLAFLSLALVSLGAPAGQRNYIDVVTHLERFQTPAGGFSLVEGGKPSLEATSNALFLSSLFALRKKINQQEVARYLQTLENGDYGYGKTAGASSDLESVRQAVLSYQHLGMAVPNVGNVASFIKSLYDSQTNLFAPRVGEKGDLKSTALAFQALEYLGELQRQWVQDIFEKVRTFLGKHVQLANNAHFSFEEKALSAVSANYYGVVLGSYVGFDFVSLPKWASFVVALQSPQDGGFFTGPDRRAMTPESTAHAVATLRLLQQTKGNTEQFVNAIAGDSLVKYVVSVPGDLRSVAQAHLAVALSNVFSRNFETRVHYEFLRASGSAGKKVVQGTQLKPVISVKTFDGMPHAGLDVEAVITYESTGETVKTKLQLKGEHYASNDFFDTTNRLGAMDFHYTISCYVVGVGEISFDLHDAKQVGYGVAVDARARLDVADKQFAQGETVAVGTDFAFGVSLHNQTHSDLHSGDFNVVFSVLDSSLVAIHSETVDGKQNAKPIRFTYTLKTSSLPAGDLVFKFDIVSATGVVHTTEVVKYHLSVPMIATQITFEGVAEGAPKYKIGETVRVTIEPASFPDLRTVAPYPAKNVSGKDASDQRKFVMDVHSRGGALLRTVAGKAQSSQDSSKYVFEVPVTATLDSIGVNVVSFRYVTVSGASFDLSNYDSRLGEVIEDSASLFYTVNANLQTVDVEEQPKATTFAYGQTIEFRFRVKDSLSGLYVHKGENGQANVYLSLKHTDETKGKEFVSANVAAEEVINATGEKVFVIEWAINPNAVQGAGVLSLSAQDADGNVIDLHDATTKKPVQLDVTVGGDIQVEHVSYSTSDAATYRETAFVIQFGLTCQNESLKSAQLRASVYRDGQLVASFLPVATNDEGVYSVSWGGSHDATPSGVYTLKFFREVDRKRAVEAHEFQEKRKKREEQLKQIEEGSETASEADKEELIVENIVSPLFEISHSHSAPSTSKLPIRAEVILAFLLGGAFLAISYQKKHYLATK